MFSGLENFIFTGSIRHALFVLRTAGVVHISVASMISGHVTVPACACTLWGATEVTASVSMTELLFSAALMF